MRCDESLYDSQFRHFVVRERRVGLILVSTGYYLHDYLAVVPRMVISSPALPTTMSRCYALTEQSGYHLV